MRVVLWAEMNAYHVNAVIKVVIIVLQLGEEASLRSQIVTSRIGRVAEDWRDCYRLYIVTNCKSDPQLQDPIKDPARFPWHEVKKVDHYYLSVDALTQPMQVKEHPSSYGDQAK
ncbi:MAG: hypothetical protein ACE5H0_14745 [Bacteroidota bacterium]